MYMENVDLERTRELVTGSPLKVTVHRAFDMMRDLFCLPGCFDRGRRNRVLTSGGKLRALTVPM